MSSITCRAIKAKGIPCTYPIKNKGYCGIHQTWVYDGSKKQTIYNYARTMGVHCEERPHPLQRVNEAIPKRLKSSVKIEEVFESSPTSVSTEDYKHSGEVETKTPEVTYSSEFINNQRLILDEIKSQNKRLDNMERLGQQVLKELTSIKSRQTNMIKEFSGLYRVLINKQENSTSKALVISKSSFGRQHLKDRTSHRLTYKPTQIIKFISSGKQRREKSILRLRS